MLLENLSKHKFISINHTLLREVELAERIANHTVCARIVNNKIRLEFSEGFIQ